MQKMITRLLYLLNILKYWKMIKNKWQKLKMCCTILLVLISLVWIFALYLRYIQSDFRVDMLGLQKVSYALSDEKYIRQIDTPFQAENFQLIELMNETNPNTLTNDAVLVISASNQLTNGEYVSLIQYIDKSNKENPLPFYIVRRKKNILFHTTKQIRGEVYDIVQMLQYFSQLLLVKKLTVISFEEGSLLTLRSLAHVRYDVFQIIDTFILINPFNPTMPVFISTPYSFIQNTKQLITRDKLRVELMNSTKMLIINTIDENVGDNKKINWMFDSSSDDKVTFGNTAIVSSKFMWNVYSYLKVDQYFKFQPFLWIIAKCFNENRQNKDLKIKDLQYILLYKELVQTKTMPMLQKRKILNRCIDFYIQNYGYDGVIFKTQCVRILRKQNVYYNENTTFLISGNNKFEVFGEAYEKLPPFDTKSQEMVYILQNVNEYKRFFIVNRKKINIRLTVQSNVLPKSMLYGSLQLQELLHDLQFKNYFLKNNTRKEIIQMCPGRTLIFPNHFGPRNSWDKRLYLQSFSTPTSFCYKANDFLMFWLQEIIDYWSLGYNMIIFSFYCTHILQTSTFSRFYWQFMINTFLAFFAVGQFLPMENILLLTIVVLIEVVFKIWKMTAEFINAPKYLVSRMLWLPVLLELVQQFQPNTYPNPWKVLGIQFYALVNDKNIVILFLQVGFAWTFLDIEDINFSSVGLICAWLFITTPEEDEQKEPQSSNHNLLVIKTGKKIKSIKETIVKFRNEVVDTITICIIALCVSEDGLILHYVTDFYVITYVLFAIHRASNDYIS